MSDFWAMATELWELSFGYILNPNKRIYWLYLVISLALAYYVYYRSNRKQPFLAYIFNRRVWLSPSARVDYLLFLCNAFLKAFLILPYIYWGFELTFEISEWLTVHYGYVEEPMSEGLAIVLYTFILSLVTDFAVYLTHLAMHKIPFLWEFHKVHHSARSMNPITQYRLHPVELLINNLVSVLIFGLITGVFSYLVVGRIHKWVFLGVNVFSWLFFVFGANLRHSHVALSYFKPLEYIFISPRQHQIHHSQEYRHWNKNIGLGGGQDPDYQTFSANLFKPFTNNFFRLLAFLGFRSN